MINNWLISNTDNWLLDGFPRTINQAKSLNQILKSCNQILNSVLLISVPNNMLVDRLLERQKIEKRSDDNMETIQVRINTYEEETKPLITYYQQENILSEIDGSQSISNVSISIEKELANIKKKINN